MVHVPYQGLAPVLVDLMGDRIDLAFVSGGNVLANERQGKLKILAVAGAARIRELPTTPAIVEFFPDFHSASWFALVAPPKTMPETAALLSQTIGETLHRPDVMMKFHALSVDPLGTSPAETAAFLKQEAARWRGVIEKAHIVQQ
jgi:tripartite-type tricarboxylate transporter receptor subunit TctC